MTKIATIEYVVPDDVKSDDVFNYIRSKQCPQTLRSIVGNPHDSPLTQCVRNVKVIYGARGAQDAARVENDIHNALISIKDVTEVKYES